MYDINCLIRVFTFESQECLINVIRLYETDAHRITIVLLLLELPRALRPEAIQQRFASEPRFGHGTVAHRTYSSVCKSLHTRPHDSVRSDVQSVANATIGRPPLGRGHAGRPEKTVEPPFQRLIITDIDFYVRGIPESI